MIPPPPRSTPTDTLVPYSSLFRSPVRAAVVLPARACGRVLRGFAGGRACCGAGSCRVGLQRGIGTRSGSLAGYLAPVFAREPDPGAATVVGLGDRKRVV